MTKKQFNEMKIPENLDEFIDNTIDEIDRKERAKKTRSLKKVAGAIAAGLAIVMGVGVAEPAIASSVPPLENVFQQIQDKITFSGEYSNYATSIGKTVYDNGIGVTLSEVYCDGESLLITYIVKNNEPFKYTKFEYDSDKDKDINFSKEELSNITGRQLLYEGDGKVNFTDENLDASGIAGLEGEFIDEYTFVGVEKYTLTTLGREDKKKIEVPNNFEYEIKMKDLRCIPWRGTEEDQMLNGEWNFKINVDVDKSQVNDIKVNSVSDDGFGIKNVVITPFEIRINTVHMATTEEFSYDVIVKDENGNNIEREWMEWNDDNCSITISKDNFKGKKLNVELIEQIKKPIDDSSWKVEDGKVLNKVSIDIK